MKQKKLLFDEITAQPYTLSLTNEPLELTANSADETGRKEMVWITAELSIQRKRDDNTTPNVFLRGSLEVRYTDSCARCGGDVSEEFTERFHYRIFSGKEPENLLAEKECSENDVENLYLESGEIDIEELLKEQVYLNLPMQNICSSECKGRCSGCGVNLNLEKCRCREDYSDSPFAVLAQLKH